MRRKKTPMTRSENMSHIRGTETKPEVYLRKKLWHLGFRYRKNRRKLPGSPDIYLQKYNTAIFVNGCFWHMHEGCDAFRPPHTHNKFWMEKFERNRNRDQRNYAELHEHGVKVIVVWECTLKKMRKDPQLEQEILEKIQSVLINEKTEPLFTEL